MIFSIEEENYYLNDLSELLNMKFEDYYQNIILKDRKRINKFMNKIIEKYSNDSDYIYKCYFKFMLIGENLKIKSLYKDA